VAVTTVNVGRHAEQVRLAAVGAAVVRTTERDDEGESTEGTTASCSSIARQQLSGGFGAR
jgi:hypothetical protein